MPEEALIKLDHVTRTYRVGDETVHALDGVSVAIEAGAFVAICGPSGSGKSTLANIIGGLDSPDKGKVTVGGLDLSKARDRQLSAFRNHNVGFVFQAFNLQTHETALENVMSPLVLGGASRKGRRTQALAALDAVGLGNRANHKPTQLSGGQRQRVAIARAIATNPAILIADEPTGNLDSARGTEIIDLLIMLNHGRGMTLLVITHDDRIATRAERIIEIHDGRLTERVPA